MVPQPADPAQLSRSAITTAPGSRAAGGQDTGSTTGRTTATTDGIDFRFPHAAGITGVRLELDFSVEPTNPEFQRDGTVWSLHLPRPQVDRLEYQYTVRAQDGDAWVTDPTNPRTVPNPFGEKSEIVFPDYREPSWLATPDSGITVELTTAAGVLDTAVPTAVWSPPGLDSATPAPLLLANDGSDMAARGSLLRWAATVATTQPLRVALLDPPTGFRDTWYAANPDYADHLASVVLPAVRSRFAVGPVIGLGASLGALSMLSVQRRHPLLIDGMVLQSGSYFTPRLDPQESGYGRFDQVCAAVVGLIAGPAENQGPVFMTCGTVEENRPNNEKMAQALTALGYSVQFDLVRDAHTMIGWRDAWLPGMEGVIADVVRQWPRRQDDR